MYDHRSWRIGWFDQDEEIRFLVPPICPFNLSHRDERAFFMRRHQGIEGKREYSKEVVRIRRDGYLRMVGCLRVLLY